MIYKAGPTARKFVYADYVRFCSSGEYHTHEGHSGWVFKTRIFRGPGARHQVRYGTECECGSTLWPAAPQLDLIDRPFDASDITDTVRAARVRYLLKAAGMSEESPIDALTSRLSARDAEIILDRHGLTDDRHTLQEIADKVGLTKARVHQIEHKAIERLRRGTL